MNLIKSIIGVALTLLAGVFAVVLVIYDRLKIWQQRRELAANEARLKKEIQKIHGLVDQQRDMVLKHSREKIQEEDRRQKARDPVDVANDIINETKDARR